MYAGQDIEFSLPAGVKGTNVTWVSVWCRAFKVDFGHVFLTDDIPASAPSLLTPTLVAVLAWTLVIRALQVLR